MIDTDKALLVSGGVAGAIKAVTEGVTIMPDFVLAHLPDWINLGIHSLIGGIIPLVLKRVYDLIFHNNKNQNGPKN